MACISKKASGEQRDEQYGFKVVPESLDEITEEWCGEALKNGSVIASDTNVSSIEITHFRNEINGVMDGGGFSGSTLVRIKLQYDGNVTGNEPPSLVCKLSLGSPNKIPFLLRLMVFAQQGGYDEYMYRQEMCFIKNVLPMMKDTGYKHPTIYFAGITDKSDRGFTAAVILNKRTKVKTVVLMEDMNGWRSSAPGVLLNKEEASMCLKNVAILHAHFWGDKGKDIKSMFKHAKPETDFRPASYSKFQAKMTKRYFSNSERIQKSIDKALASEWKTSKMILLKGDALRPYWFTVEPLEDGFYPIFDDPLVVEMLGVLAERSPDYYRTKVKSFIKKPAQTLLHGDFHGGNHMYGQEDNEGQIVALDYQFAGPGRAVTEFLYFFMMSLSSHSLEELMDLSKEYHYTLEEHGVSDYSLAEFQDEIEMMVVGMCLAAIQMMQWVKPSTILNMFLKLFGEKGEEFKKFFENGMYGKFFVLSTSIYLSNKDSFMIEKVE